MTLENNPAESTFDLIRRAQSGDESACEQLIQENAGLIWSIVRRFFGRGQDSDDLYQLGCVGFLKAVRGFDLSFGTQFSTYAVPKIAGEIRRFLRDDGPVKVSRELKEQARRVAAVRTELENREGHTPTVSELSQATGFTAEEIAMCESAAAPPDSLERPIGSAEDGFTLASILSGDGIEDGIVEQESLRTAIESLPERERMIILLRYYRSFTQDRTARIIGVSQVQVSRLEKRAINRLREKLK